MQVAPTVAHGDSTLHPRVGVGRGGAAREHLDRLGVGQHGDRDGGVGIDAGTRRRAAGRTGVDLVVGDRRATGDVALAVDVTCRQVSADVVGRTAATTSVTGAPTNTPARTLERFVRTDRAPPLGERGEMPVVGASRPRRSRTAVPASLSGHSMSAPTLTRSTRLSLGVPRIPARPRRRRGAGTRHTRRPRRKLVSPT